MLECASLGVHIIEGTVDNPISIQRWGHRPLPLAFSKVMLTLNVLSVWIDLVLVVSETDQVSNDFLYPNLVVWADIYWWERRERFTLADGQKLRLAQYISSTFGTG